MHPSRLMLRKGGETMTETQDVSELRCRLRSLLPMLAERYQVASVALFGSYVRAEQRPDSDLDVLVTFAETPSLFEFIRLEQFLTDQLGVRVDLVMRDALKPHIGEQILHEATLV